MPPLILLRLSAGRAVKFWPISTKSETSFNVSKQVTSASNPIYTYKKLGTAPQIFGTVPVNFEHGTLNYRRVNVSVPKKVRHWCPNFYCIAFSAPCLNKGCRDYLREVVSAPLKVWAQVPNFFWYRYVYTSIIGSAKHLGCRADFFVRVNGVSKTEIFLSSLFTVCHKNKNPIAKDLT